MEPDAKKALPIVLKKVKVHNLKGVDLTLYQGEFVAFSGVSGSGKSSLAFDTIYVEGQRRYIESLSHETRRFLADLPKPEAESISGIAPTIAIEQKLSGRTPRSTVGTLTGIYDCLRVLYARVATPHCPVSGEAVTVQSREKMAAEIGSFPKGAKVAILAPFARGKKGEFREEFQTLVSQGYTRVRVDGSWVDLTEVERLDPKGAHDVDLVIDRVVIEEGIRGRILEGIQKALELGGGLFSAVEMGTGEERLFSESAYSPGSNLSYGPLKPQDFSFNHPEGMCPLCQGLGHTFDFDLGKVIDPEKSIAEDCCSIASSYETVRYKNIYDNLARIYKFSVKMPWKRLSEEAKGVFLNGVKERWLKMEFVHPVKGSRWTDYVPWRGVLHEARERFHAAKSEGYRQKMAELMREDVCPACAGARIQPYPAAALLGGKRIAEVTALPLGELEAFFTGLKLSELERQVAEELLKEIREKISFLLEVGLTYLSLDRTAPTLSGGESQRVRLASQLGSGLTGAIYILDEPSIGLHPIDHHRLIGTLKALSEQGNTLLVVEHDGETLLAADRIVDVGPGAGKEGGEILAIGTPEEVMANPRSLTGAYLAGRQTLHTSKKRKGKKGEWLVLKGARHHNLKGVTLKVPLGLFVAVSGVSGSGKSSLISDTLYPLLANLHHQAKLSVGAHEKLEGGDKIDKIIAVDQSPIGRTPRSNPATYIKLFDEIRDLFASLPESQLRGLTASHFSFNGKVGSCPYCSGLGQVRLDMDFMEDAWVECPQCKGRRFDPEVLAVEWKGKNIYEVLKTDVAGAMELFEAIPQVRRKLEVLQQVGLSYLALGQPSTTLSGGEAQRIKLAKELVRPATGRTLYLFDEPTTGLHYHDVQRLIGVLQQLVERGNTVLVIEHNMDLVKAADWVVEVGPGPGIYGGEIVAEGPPDKIAQGETATGRALRGEFSFLHAPKKREALKEAPPIVVERAAQNNLKEVTLSIPRGKITLFTGPSGSGKSSLAFETLYAEGQRRYTETLPAYARAQVKPLPKPKVERILGLPPSIALEQKTGGLNPRSTVGTLSEVYDSLRVLYAHLGTPYCPETGEEIRHISKEFVVNKLLELPAGEKVQILSPLTLSPREEFVAVLERLRKQGFLRIRLNGRHYELDEEIPFEKHRKNELFLVIDRLKMGGGQEGRLFEAVEKGSRLSDGIVVAETERGDLFYNLSFAVESTGRSYPPITHQTFSFNHEAGMCPECQGIGSVYGAPFFEERENLELSLFEIVDRLWKGRGSERSYRLLEAYFAALGIDPEAPLETLPPDQLHKVVQGGPEIALPKLFKQGTLHWVGLQPLFARAARMGRREMKEALIPLMRATPCPGCQGERLNPLARAVRLKGVSLPALCRLSLEEAARFLEGGEVPLFLQETKGAIEKYLSFLLSMGLGYLSLSRSAPSLSGGELQRVRLARQIGSELTSCLYILDEPTIGLHPSNNEKLNAALKKLASLGNTLLLVEHDPLTIQIADYLVDFGPGAGKGGGRVVAEGTLPQILSHPDSLTGAYLSGRKKIALPSSRRPFKKGEEIRIEGASLHNLKQLTLSLPKGAISCLTGVSGSGKSTLLRHLLLPAAQGAVQTRKRGQFYEYRGAKFYGLFDFDQVIAVDQGSIGQTARSDVSTYADIQPHLRTFFASLPEAAKRGLQPRHFSHNHRQGMCKMCWGLGYKTVDLQFLPAVRLTCEACHGFRLNPLALEVRYKGKHLGELLQLSVEGALLTFSPLPKVAKRLQLLSEVGLAYLQLNQELATLSGGEAQRLRLSRELSKRGRGKILYLIDEPTVGLHPDDIAKLIPIFHRLADQRHTLLLIEHNLDLIAQADYLVDLGPDAGEAGGEILEMGTPEEVAARSGKSRSKTAPYLREYLEKI